MNTPTNTDNRAVIMEESRAALAPHIVEFIDQCNAGPMAHSQLINVLHKVQGHYGHLQDEHLNAVAQLMQIPTAKVTGVATFYHFFRLKPQGKFVIQVCLGTACYVKGADRILEKLQEELGIVLGETTKDGLFSLENSRCVGTCGLAPVLMIGEKVYGQITPDKIPGIIEKYVTEANE